MNMKHSIRGIDLSAADFSDALMWIKDGKRVMRRGWNSKGQFVFIATVSSLVSQHCSGLSIEPTEILMQCSSDKVLSAWSPSTSDRRTSSSDWWARRSSSGSAMSTVPAPLR